ncbi:MAG TPA: RNA polymerase sigma factor [Acidimicrobiales bacterium]|nr:RNA polymerase sigma factor [Acidimicrobiales bacterium]
MGGPSRRHAGTWECTPVEGLADFEHCFEANFAFVHRFIARRVGTPLADDLTAETFATAFRRRQSFDPCLGPVRAWLLGIANNLVREHWRAEQRFLGLEARLEAGTSPSEGGSSPEERATASEVEPRIANALASLPPEQRDVLLLHAWGGLSEEEIAAALRSRPGTVRSRMWRARRALRAQLSDREPNDLLSQGCERSPRFRLNEEPTRGDEHGR